MNVIKFSIVLGVTLWGLFLNSQFRFILLTILILSIFLDFAFYSIFKTPLRRKLMIVANEEPYERRAYSNIYVDNSNQESFIRNYNSKISEDERIRANMIAILAFGRAIKHANLGKKFVFDNLVETDGVGVFLPVDVAGKDLAVATVQNVERETLEGIQKLLRAKVKNLKLQNDKKMNFQLWVLSFFPGFVIDVMLNVAAFVSYNLGVTIPLVDFKKDHFGCCAVSNISAFSIYDTQGPFVHYARNLIGGTICSERKVPVAKNGKIVVERRAKIGMTFDCRVISPYEEGEFTRELKRIWLHPEELSSQAKCNE